MLRKALRSLKNYFSRPFLVVFVLGVLILALAIWLDSLAGLGLLAHIARGLEVVGIAFIAVALTAPISEYFQLRTFSQRMSILRGAQDSGITMILQSRLEEAEAFTAILHEEFDKASTISLLCVAFPEALGILPYAEPVADKLEDPKIPVRILLLNPEGEAARQRMEVETGRATIGDIERSVDNLRWILRRRAKTAKVDYPRDRFDYELAGRLGMSVHLYDFPPSAFMFMTDECLLLEQYHLGRLPDTWEGEPIGRRVPLLRFAPHSKTYQIMEQHFDHVWNRNSRDVTMLLLAEGGLEPAAAAAMGADELVQPVLAAPHLRAHRASEARHEDEPARQVLTAADLRGYRTHDETKREQEPARQVLTAADLRGYRTYDEIQREDEPAPPLPVEPAPPDPFASDETQGEDEPPEPVEVERV